MEALRIVAMSGIMMHHFMAHAQNPAEIPWGAFYLVDTFFYVGLPVFFMISGGFGMHFSLRGLIRLILLILIFGMVNLGLLETVGWGVTRQTVVESILYPVTGSPYWFMQIYVMLYVTSPLINAGLQRLEKPQLRTLIIIWAILIYYPDTPLAKGSYMYGLFIYCLGYCCSRFEIEQYLRTRWWLAGYLTACSISGVIDWWIFRSGGETTYFHCDSNLLMMVGAVCLYLCFRRLTISGRWIQSVAGASLGCYLLQDGWFGRIYLYKWQAWWMYAHGDYYRPDMIWMFVLSFLTIWVVSWILTNGIRWIFHITRLTIPPEWSNQQE